MPQTAHRSIANVSAPMPLPDATQPAEMTQSELLDTLRQALLVHHNDRQFTEAISLYRRILASNPYHGATLHCLGVALGQLGKFGEALGPLSQALMIHPESSVIHNHYGNALVGLCRYGEAVESYDRAIVCDGNLAYVHYNRGVAFRALGQKEAALACYARATELNPAYSRAYNNRGMILSEMGRTMDALNEYKRAIDARPQFVDAWINQANLLRRLRRHEEALDSSDGAIMCEPSNPHAHNCRGATLSNMGRFEEAIASYDRAIELDPTSPEFLCNKGMIKLVCGDLREGWQLYESRWGVKSFNLTDRFSDKLRWRGSEPVNGKVVLLHAEQGFGDTIQFSRYCVQVAARGARVLLSIPNALQPLLRSLEGVHEIIGETQDPAFDFHCPLMSLPLALGTELTNIPAAARYLGVDREAKARWADRLKARAHIPKIGLVWSGRPSHDKDLERSIPLVQLLPIIRRQIHWVSLQKEVRASDRCCLANTPAIERLGEETTDFGDAAALIENLDLVITVDTALAHVAGALGKPVWILLPYVPDWRWLRDRKDSPWYPSVRLFRQSSPADWRPVIDCVIRELRCLFNTDAQIVSEERRAAGT